MKQTVIFLLGVSGSGKTTIMNELIQHDHICYVPSYTTRDPRPGEVPWERYNFISAEQFQQGIQHNEFLEYATVHQTNFYGTKTADIVAVLQQDKTPIKEIDILWLEKLRQRTDIPFSIKTIFLDISDELMVQRILKRGATPQEEIDRRIQSAHHERATAQKLCDLILDGTGTVPEVMVRVEAAIAQLTI